MEKIKLEEIAEVTRGHIISGDPDHYIERVTTDSRNAGEDALFIPLVGGNHDAHDFVGSARENGCRTFLISEERVRETLSGADVVLVSDTLKAMQDLAYHYLQSLDIRKIAVTGSVGKTSTRDMVYYIMSEKYKTARPEKNYNNEVGVPLTIFGLDSSYEAVVFEEGLERAGDIHRLSGITRPDVAAITNIGISHLENFKSRDALFQAKLEVADFLSQNGTLVINSDSDYLSKDNINRDINIITCGSHEDDDYYVHDIKDMGTDGISFVLRTPDTEQSITLPVPGAHNAVNAALAAACSAEFGATIEDVVNGLSKLELSGKRLLVTECGGIKVIDDSYNAAPSSMKSAVNTLMSTKGKRHIAVLAGMNELGDDWKKYHVEVGSYAAGKGVDVVIGIGDKARAIVEGAGESSSTYAVWFDDKESFFTEMNDLIHEGDVVIIKGSNAYKMSEVAERLLGGQN